MKVINILYLLGIMFWYGNNTQCLLFDNQDVVFVNLQVSPIVDNSLKEERELFIKSWMAFAEHGKSDLSDLKKQLEAEFDQEEKAFEVQSDNHLFFHMTYENRVIGYISYQIEPNHVLCIKEFALLPEYCTPIIARELLFSGFDYVGGITRLYLEMPSALELVEHLLESLSFVRVLDAKTVDSKLVFELKIQDCIVCLDDSECLNWNVDFIDSQEELELFDAEQEPFFLEASKKSGNSQESLLLSF